MRFYVRHRSSQKIDVLFFDEFAVIESVERMKGETKK